MGQAGILETAGQTPALLPTDVALKRILKSSGAGDGRKEALEICQVWSHESVASAGAQTKIWSQSLSFYLHLTGTGKNIQDLVQWYLS